MQSLSTWILLGRLLNALLKERLLEVPFTVNAFDRFLFEGRSVRVTRSKRVNKICSIQVNIDKFMANSRFS